MNTSEEEEDILSSDKAESSEEDLSSLGMDIEEEEVPQIIAIIEKVKENNRQVDL